MLPFVGLPLKTSEGCSLLCLVQDAQVSLILGQTKITILMGKQMLLQLKVLK